MMLKIKTLSIFFITAIAPLFGGETTLPVNEHHLIQQEASVALIVSCQGSAKVVRSNGQIVKLGVGSALFPGDKIETERSTWLKVLFLDGTEVSLSANSDFSIDDYSYGGDTPRSVMTFKNSTFHFLVGKIAEEAPEEFIIETETATIGIRGSGGEIITSDGTQGFPANLRIRTIPGHILEVTTRLGELFVLENSSIALNVTADGIATWIQVTGSLIVGKERAIPLGAPGPAAPRPVDSKNSVPPIPWILQDRIVVGMRRRLYKKIDCKLGEDVVSKLFIIISIGERHMADKMRDIEEADQKERASAMPLMNQLGEGLKADAAKRKEQENKEETNELKKSKGLSNRKVSLGKEREKISGSEVLKRLSEEQKRVIDAQKRNTTSTEGTQN